MGEQTCSVVLKELDNCTGSVVQLQSVIEIAHPYHDVVFAVEALREDGHFHPYSTVNTD